MGDGRQGKNRLFVYVRSLVVFCWIWVGSRGCPVVRQDGMLTAMNERLFPQICIEKGETRETGTCRVVGRLQTS